LDFVDAKAAAVADGDATGAKLLGVGPGESSEVLGGVRLGGSANAELDVGISMLEVSEVNDEVEILLSFGIDMLL
jgi:hypothetical protein